MRQDKHFSIRLFGLLLTLIFSVLFTHSSFGQDIDGDGISDALEDQLLTQFAPVVYADNLTNAPPLPVDWYVRHCQLRWYANKNDPPNTGGIGNTGTAQLTTDSIIQTILQHEANGEFYHYRLTFKVLAHRVGDDPSDPMSWTIANDTGMGIYGRVNHTTLPNAPDTYLVQYYMFFGWNESLQPPTCEAGNHEGDIIAIDLDVDNSDPLNPQIVRAVYHNHGRQIFVDDPSLLTFELGTHPVMYLESGQNEPWPWASSVGFKEGSVTCGFHTNKRFFGVWFPPLIPLFLIGDEYGDFPAVRPHNGGGVRYFVDAVVNLGERNAPYNSPEAQFVEFYGKSAVNDPTKGASYGDRWSNGCTILGIDFEFLNTHSPDGPQFQSINEVEPGKGKIWDRMFRPPVTFVDSSAPTNGDGASWSTPRINLMQALDEAPAVFVRDIWVRGGTYTPTPPGGDQSLSFNLHNCLSVLGGYSGSSGTGTGMWNPHRDPATNVTILSGDLNGDDLPGFGNRTDNSSSVVTSNSLDSTSLIDGFAIMGGGTMGMTIVGVSNHPVVSNCMFCNNGGLGGMFITGHPSIKNCIFNGNSFIDVWTQGNPQGVMKFTNCTFSGNLPTSGIGLLQNNAVVTNCILWYNQVGAAEAFLNVEHSVIKNIEILDSGVGINDGGGNINANPLFVDADGADNIPGTLDDDLRLAPGSPATDAGDNFAPGLIGIATDLDGLLRFHDDTGMPDTGNGTPGAPIVDMGAYERQTNSCLADIMPAGGNALVDIDDLVAVLNAFGPCPAPPAPCDADITPPGGNCTVNIDDLVAVLNAFGACP